MSPKDHVDSLVRVEVEDKGFGGRWHKVMLGYTLLDYCESEGEAEARAEAVRSEILPCVEAAVADALAPPFAAPVTLTTAEGRAAMRDAMANENLDLRAPAGSPLVTFRPHDTGPVVAGADVAALLDELDWLHAVVRDVAQDGAADVYRAGLEAGRKAVATAERRLILSRLLLLERECRADGTPLKAGGVLAAARLIEGMPEG
jgi:hypothetical protein